MSEEWSYVISRKSICPHSSIYADGASHQNDPISAFVATHTGQIRAFACYNVSAFENAFGPIGADVEARGLGLGRVLLRRCMAELYALGHPYAEICWVRSFDFYAHTAGANISRVCWFLEKKIEDSTLR